MLAQSVEQAAIDSSQNGQDPDFAAYVVSGILRSENPEERLLNAISYGAIPDQVGLELAEHLGEFVEVTNLDKLVGIIAALSEGGIISTQTEQILFLAIIEMASEGEVGQNETGDKPVEVAPTVPAPAVPELIGHVALIKAATELQQQFGTASAVPADKLEEIQQTVKNLFKEEFASLRQFLSSVLLAQAELPACQWQIDVFATFEVMEILLRQRQRELTSAIFIAYETLHKQGFRLRDRDKADRPLVTITSINLIRNRFRAWLDSHESGLGKEELQATGNAVSTLEQFLITAAHESVQDAIQRDLDTRLRERIIQSGMQALDILNSELVAALPQTKEEVLRQIVAGEPRTEEELLQPPVGYLDASLNKLGSCLRTISSKNLAEADGALEEILMISSMCAFWRQELANLASSDYNPAAADQQPSLSPIEKRLAFFEVEHKELDQIRLEIDEQIEQLTESRGSSAALKKLVILRGITHHKLADLDQLIAPLRPSQTRFRPQAATDGKANGIPMPPLPFSINTLPPVPPASTAGKSVPAPTKEASHGHG